MEPSSSSPANFNWNLVKYNGGWDFTTQRQRWVGSVVSLVKRIQRRWIESISYKHSFNAPKDHLSACPSVHVFAICYLKSQFWWKLKIRTEKIDAFCMDFVIISMKSLLRLQRQVSHRNSRISKAKFWSLVVSKDFINSCCCWEMSTPYLKPNSCNWSSSELKITLQRTAKLIRFKNWQFLCSQMEFLG